MKGSEASKVTKAKRRSRHGQESPSEASSYHSGSSEILEPITKEKLPLFYRLILKVPVVDRIANASGIFWALVVPILVFANSMLGLVLLLTFPFPTNLILVLMVPGSLLVVFIKLSLERFINFWNLLVAKPHSEWNIEKKVEEYVAMLDRHKKAAKHSNPDSTTF